MKFILLLLLLIPNSILQAQTISSFTDSRDGQSYATVSYEIKNKSAQTTITWMAENLNYDMKGAYYRFDTNNEGQNFGRLYTWPLAIKACPNGWHLPTDEDWRILVNLYGGEAKAGRHLKSKSALWSDGGKGTNKSLFNAIPYGTGDGSTTYPNFGHNAIFWSASEMDEQSAWDWILVSGWDKILRSDGLKLNTANSVRCVKDE